MTDVLPNNGENGLVLAQRPDLRIGETLVRPSIRTVEGPAGAVIVEPRVMQVLLAIADADGGVVDRDTLIRRCWDNRIVGDDAVNRAISEVRRAARESGSTFGVETIPRVGYRLVGASMSPNRAKADQLSEPRQVSRRTVIAGALAAAGAGGFSLWSITRTRRLRQFNQLIDRGEEALLYRDPSTNSWQYFQQAVAIRPDSAKAQGLLAAAQAMRAEYSQPSNISGALVDGERAARAALAIDPKEPNARLALVLLERSTLDFSATEDRLRAIIAAAPDNTLVMSNLWNMLQSVGRSRDALALVERAVAVAPLAAGNQYPRAQLLWILRQTAEADRVIDRAIRNWPLHRFVRFARFTIYAYTDRARAAQAMLDDPKTRPQIYGDTAIALWRVSLTALDRRTPANVSAATQANLETARQTPALSNQAVMVLSALGEIDAAFEIANTLLLAGRVPAKSAALGRGSRPASSTAWRFAPWLFTPPLAAMRADPRFVSLCDGIGLTEYWEKRGIKPDYQLGLA